MDDKEAVCRAISSMKISGFDFDQESEEMWARVGTGELTTEDVRRITLEKLDRLKIEHPERFTIKDET